MNVDVKLLIKILASQVQQHIKKGHAPGSSWFHSMEARIVEHMQINQHNTVYKQNKDQNHMIISIVAEND
jgi:hypothetical protein